MGMINDKQVNSTVINAATENYVDCSIDMASSSGGSCVETRVIAQALYLSAYCGGDITSASLRIGSSVTFTGAVGGKIKMVIPVTAGMTFTSETSLSLLASEIVGCSAQFAGHATCAITKSSVLRKGNPGITFNKYGLQYLAAGRIIINKNKYL